MWPTKQSYEAKPICGFCPQDHVLGEGHLNMYMMLHIDILIELVFASLDHCVIDPD